MAIDGTTQWTPSRKTGVVGTRFRLGIYNEWADAGRDDSTRLAILKSFARSGAKNPPPPVQLTTIMIGNQTRLVPNLLPGTCYQRDDYINTYVYRPSVGGATGAAGPDCTVVCNFLCTHTHPPLGEANSSLQECIMVRLTGLNCAVMLLIFTLSRLGINRMRLLFLIVVS